MCNYEFWLVAVVILYSSNLAVCSHFRGGIIQWRPVDANNFDGRIEIIHRMSWRRSHGEIGVCSDADIGTTRLFGTGELICSSGCNGKVGDLQFFCTDFSESEDWVSGERSYIYNISTSVTNFEASFGGGCWITLEHGGCNWEVRVKGNLSPRSDNGRINSSPITTITPILRLQESCDYNIRIPVQDADRDVIRCRWANLTKSECGGICNAVPNATLDQDNCILSWTPPPLALLSRSNWYAVAIQIEDFVSPSSTTPMSSVPLQFLINVFNTSASCTGEGVRPFLVSGETPQDGYCIAVPFNTTYTAGIVASSGNHNLSITHFITSSPFGLRTSAVVQSQHDATLYYANVTWTPKVSQYENYHLYCFRAVSSNQLETSQWCISLLSGDTGSLTFFGIECDTQARTLICSFNSTSSSNAVTWMRNGVTVNNDYEQTSVRFNDGTTENRLTALKPSNFHGNFTCIVRHFQCSNTALQESFNSAYLEIDVPTITVLSAEATTISENGLINITCQVKGPAQPTITWLRTRLFTNNSFSVVKNSSRISITPSMETIAESAVTVTENCRSLYSVTSRLLITNVEQEDGVTYVCRIDNSVSKNITINITTTDNCTPNPCQNGGQCIDLLQDFQCNCTGTNHTGRQCEQMIDSTDAVETPSMPDIVTPTDPQPLLPVNLTCEANGTIPLSYRWFQDGQLIEGEINSYLYIDQFQPGNRGYYTCEAINAAGIHSNASDSSLLTLQGIRQYLIKVNLTSGMNIEDLKDEINSILRSTDRFDNNAEFYEVEQQTRDNATNVISLILTLNVSNATTNDAEDIQEAIKQKLFQSEILLATSASVNILRFDGCPAIENEIIEVIPGFQLHFHWNETEIGNSVPYECPCRTELKLDQLRKPERLCEGTYTYGAMWEPLIDSIIEDCRLTDITLQLCQAFLANNSKDLSETLVNVTSNSSSIRAVDVSAATILLDGLEAEATSLRDERITENFLNTIDNLIQADPEVIVQSQEESGASSRLLGILGDFSDNVQVTNANNITFVQSSYAIHVTNIDTTEFDGETLTVNLGSVDDAARSEIAPSALSIMQGVTNTMTSDTLTAVVRVPSSTFTELGLGDNQVHRLSYTVFTQGALFQSLDENQNGNITLGSVVVSVRINGTNEALELNNTIEVQFQSSKLVRKYPNTLCGIWNPDGLGEWSLDSCKIIETEQDASESQTSETSQNDACQIPAVTVQYKRPGHFGLLLDLTYEFVEPIPYTSALEVITYIALPISLICLVILIITYLSNKQLRTSGHGQVLINMCIALMCLYITFLIGGQVAPVPPICGITAALLQYFMLVFFAWTTVEAIYLYRKLVKVLGTHIPKFVLKAALIAWLVPWIIVILSVGPGYRHYYRMAPEVLTCDNETSTNAADNKPSGFCRAVGPPFWAGTVLPFVAVFIFNFIAFIFIMVSLYRHGKEKFENRENEGKIKFVKQQLLIAFGLTTLFGLGWVFGLAASGTTIHGLTLALQIIFSLFVGCQGVLFFVLHGLKKTEARNEWKLWFSVFTRKPLRLYNIPTLGAKATGSEAIDSTDSMATLPKDATFPRKSQKEMDSQTPMKDSDTAGEKLTWQYTGVRWKKVPESELSKSSDQDCSQDQVVTNTDAEDGDDTNANTHK